MHPFPKPSIILQTMQPIPKTNLFSTLSRTPKMHIATPSHKQPSMSVFRLPHLFRSLIKVGVKIIMEIE